MSNKKRPRKRSRGKNFVALPVTGSLALSTLNDDTVLTTSLLGTNFTEDLYAISCDLSVSVRSLTAGQGDPMSIGIAHSDYSATEILEHISVALAGPGSKIEQERSRRLIRKTGVFQQQGNQDDSFTSMNMIGRDGSRIVRTTLKFTAQSGKALNLYVHNRSGGALSTGSVLEFDGTIFGRWRV